jgi:hypothetical protein
MQTRLLSPFVLPDNQHRTKLPSNPSHKIHKRISPAGIQSGLKKSNSKTVTGSRDPAQPRGYVDVVYAWAGPLSSELL